MNTLQDRFNQVQHRIKKAELHANRPQGSVTLIAVSKKHPMDKILACYQLTQRHFSENYLQESFPKILATQDLDIVWHFTGTLQSNKAAQLAQHFSWIHSIDRLSIATALNRYRPATLPPLNVCIQLNLNNDPTKSGISVEQCSTLAHAILTLPRLRLRGLMCISGLKKSLTERQQEFSYCKAIFMTLKQTIPSLDTLSMGMSEDLEAAILEGSTMVRIGTALFGSRGE